MLKAITNAYERNTRILINNAQFSGRIIHSAEAYFADLLYMAYSYNRSFILEFLKKINMIENLIRLLLTAGLKMMPLKCFFLSYLMIDLREMGGTLLLGVS